MTQTYYRYKKIDGGYGRTLNRCYYKHDHIICAQVLGFDDVLAPFLKQNDFTHIIEIGTANGGFTYFLHDILPQAQLNTYDILSTEELNNRYISKLPNVRIFISNIFTNNYEITSSKFLKFIEEADRLLVVIDGGNKKREAMAIAPYLRKGDYIMLHDYKGIYGDNPHAPEWSKFEVSEQDLIDIANNGNLEIVHPEFEAVVWGCLQKK